MRSFLYSFAGALAAMVFALVGVSSLAQPTTLPLPSINGPSIGDPLSNLYLLTQNYIAGSGHASKALGSISQTSGQANCTQVEPLGQNTDKFYQATTSASTGYVCLPTAIAGRSIYIANATGQTVDLYSNAISYAPGTADKINGTAGTTAYTGLTSGKLAVCISPVNGFWNCGSIS